MERGKRNAVRQLLHARSDKRKVATWMSDLKIILRVLHVRSVTCIRQLLTIRP